MQQLLSPLIKMPKKLAEGYGLFMLPPWPVAAHLLLADLKNFAVFFPSFILGITVSGLGMVQLPELKYCKGFKTPKVF